jgi:hypothetical protein
MVAGRLAVIAALTIGCCPSRSALPARAEVSCVCAPQLCSCNVRRTGGLVDAKVCWGVRVRCHNGGTMSARACERVAAGATLSHSFDRDDLKGWSQCERGIESTQVENVTAESF